VGQTGLKKASESAFWPSFFKGKEDGKAQEQAVQGREGLHFGLTFRASRIRAENGVRSRHGASYVQPGREFKNKEQVFSLTSLIVSIGAVAIPHVPSKAVDIAASSSAAVASPATSVATPARRRLLLVGRPIGVEIKGRKIVHPSSFAHGKAGSKQNSLRQASS
jgi:hypothetical protein